MLHRRSARYYAAFSASGKFHQYLGFSSPQKACAFWGPLCCKPRNDIRRLRVGRRERRPLHREAWGRLFVRTIIFLCLWRKSLTGQWLPSRTHSRRDRPRRGWRGCRIPAARPLRDFLICSRSGILASAERAGKKNLTCKIPHRPFPRS